MKETETDENKTFENELGKTILKDLGNEIGALRRLIIVAENTRDVDSAIKLSATIARIVRDAYAVQYQLDQLVSATLKLGAETVVDKINKDNDSAREKAKKEAIDQKPMIEGDLAALGPMALKTIANMAGISQRLGGNQKDVPHPLQNDKEPTE